MSEGVGEVELFLPEEGDVLAFDASGCADVEMVEVDVQVA